MYYVGSKYYFINCIFNFDKKKDNYLKYLFIMIDSKDEYLIWKYIEWVWGVMW